MDYLRTDISWLGNDSFYLFMRPLKLLRSFLPWDCFSILSIYFPFSSRVYSQTNTRAHTWLSYIHRYVQIYLHVFLRFPHRKVFNFKIRFHWSVYDVDIVILIEDYKLNTNSNGPLRFPYLAMRYLYNVLRGRYSFPSGFLWGVFYFVFMEIINTKNLITLLW